MHSRCISFNDMHACMHLCGKIATCVMQRHKERPCSLRLKPLSKSMMLPAHHYAAVCYAK